MASDEAAYEVAQQWYEHKSRLMEASLGKEHDMVMHAIIPYAVGGALDLYYYPHGVPGTAIATKELSEQPNEGSSNRMYRSYELVMFTKHRLDLDVAKDENAEFGRAHMNINAILERIARYSAQARLNPNETCEFPADMERVGGKCLIFDGYACHSDDVAENFGLLAILEVFRSEMEYARKHGGAKLIQRLKAKGHYPYSDLEREPVA
jgi:suppressor of fused protein SUFU